MARETIGKKVVGVVQIRIRQESGELVEALLRMRFDDGSLLDFEPVCDDRSENYVKATFHHGTDRRLPRQRRRTE